MGYLDVSGGLAAAAEGAAAPSQPATEGGLGYYLTGLPQRPSPHTQVADAFENDGRLAMVVVEVEATAYSADWRSCGWTWGVAVPVLPLLIPLCCGTYASGGRAVPVVPRRRRGLAAAPLDRVRGAALGLGAAGLLSLRRVTARAAPQAVAAAVATAAAGGALGAPVGKYWAETKLAGLPYTGRTASGTVPRPPRPPLASTTAWEYPLVGVLRLLTLRWGALDGTVAADPAYYPFGTRVVVPGWGAGRVEDVGGKVKGPRRLDLFHADREAALRFGRRTLRVRVER